MNSENIMHKTCRYYNVKKNSVGGNGYVNKGKKRINGIWNKGYTKDNIQLLHKDVNMIKKEYDQTYFLNLCNVSRGPNAAFHQREKIRTPQPH